jgi:tetratricopeptide (TPR) repeat protein
VRSFRRTVLSCLALGACLVLLWGTPAAAQSPEAVVFISQGVLAYDDKRYDEAIRLFSDVLKRDPDSVEALYYLGLVHLARLQPALAAESLEKARTLAPQDLLVRFQLGVAYFTLEQYDKAEPLLAGVFAEQPKLESLGYYVGFMRYRKKDYQGALQAFKTGASTDLTVQQLTKFYAGLTHGVLGLSEQAIVEVEEALRLQPVSPLTGPAERIRDTIIAARSQEQRLRAEIRLGVFYDDNVSVNPQSGTDPLVQTLRSTPNRGGGRSTGEIAALRTDYSWFRSGPWEATATYSFFHTQPNNPGLFRSGKIQDHLGGLAGFYRGTVGTMPFQLGTQYNYDYLLLNDAPFMERNTGTLFGTLVENPGNLTTFVGRLQFKNFLLDEAANPPDNRDARNWMVGPTHVFRFAGDRHLLRIGYQFDYEDASGRNFSYHGHRAITGGLYTLPWGETRLRYDYEIHFRLYPDLQTSLPTTSPNTMTRHDTEQIHAFRIEKPLPNGLTLSAEYQGDFSQSNLAVFNFHRNVFSLIMTWTY